MNKQTKRKTVLLALLSLTACLTACTDGMILAATPNGVREFYRGQNGLITTGKSAPNVADEYHSTQRATDRTSLELLQMQLQGEK
jgi:(2Fe-2S) ferredoxin